MERIYIDAFAGPGLNHIRGSQETVDGSPLIATKAISANGARFDRLFFIERDAASARELEAILPGPPRTEVIVGDVNGELPKLIRRLPQRSPTFVFLDTDGIEPKWSTIQAIAPWRTELLINFPLGMSINRNYSSPKADEYFGSSDWRSIWESSRTGRTRELVDFYKDRLREIGYVYPSALDRSVETSRGQSLYYLIHVSKVPIAASIMKWVEKQPRASGQMSFPTDEQA